MSKEKGENGKGEGQEVTEIPHTHVAVSLKQADEVVARLTAVRGSLQDHLEDNPVIYQGVPALLNFLGEICKGLKGRVLGAGSGPLQDLLVRDINQQLHEVDFAKHFSTTKFEEKIKQMNGYQAHVASPEMAMRALVADAFQDAAPVAQWMIVQMRTFLSQSTREIANEVAERDPEKRSDITDMIAQGIEEVLDEWEREASEMVEMLMEMEKLTVSAVFFQRLAVKRKQRGLVVAPEPSGRFARATKSMRESGVGIMSKLFSRKEQKSAPGDAEVAGRRRRLKPPRRGGIDEDPDEKEEAEEPVSSRPSNAEASFSRKSAPQASTRGSTSGGEAYVPHAAKSIAFVQHLGKWETVSPVMLRSGETQFQVLKGKFTKKAHASGMRSAVTKVWSERYFIFDYSNGDLFYWKEQPTPELCKSNADQEHYKGTRVVLARAKFVAASAEDMKGFGGDSRLGVCMENVYIKGKLDQLIVAFANTSDHKMFVRHVCSQVQKLAEMAKEEDTKEADGDEKGADDDNAPETPSPQERGTGKRHTDADEDDEDEYASAAEDEENEEEEGEDDLEPDSPTTGYQKGGLGVGSRFFSPEGVRDAEGAVRIVGSIIVPSQFRSKGPKSKGMNGEADAFEDMERSRVEGEDALTWLCSDMSVYVTIVTDTVSATLPKMAVMILCERVISNELLHILQKRALQWSSTVAQMNGETAPRVLHSKEACESALTDIEEEMVNVRMASSAASLAATREGSKVSDVRCVISVRSLALANHARILAAAQKQSPEEYINDNYGPLFPRAALEASEDGARRLFAMLDDVGSGERGMTQLVADPLAPAMSIAAPARNEGGKGGGQEALREGKRSGFSTGVVSSVVEYATKTTSGWTGRGKRVTDADVEAEHRTMASSGPQSRPQLRAHPVQQDRGEAGTGAGKPQVMAADGDPLQDPLASRSRAPAMGFGVDPLAAPRAMLSSNSTPNMKENSHGDSGSAEEDGNISEGGPLQQSSMRGPLRGPPRRSAPGPGTAPPPSRSVPPRRAPPGPGAAYGPARPAPPPVGRPAPLRAAPPPGRPAPVAPARGPPMRPAPQRQTQEDLPL